ncbi:Apoptosis-stimulating of p53 protein 2 [Trichinella murrelli]|uniref:Apoptosis-stimulating of p53 protein 2 n=1 Tax=Trichinella murrelli TaxID=144512 RepID=A0A0V0UFB4_9BILA|nr:Apoptosis-stimulating of p53 protein 2 [Trichinella murrelli]
MNGSLWKVEATSRMLLQANALKSRCMRRSIKPRSSRLVWLKQPVVSSDRQGQWDVNQSCSVVVIWKAETCYRQLCDQQVQRRPDGHQQSPRSSTLFGQRSTKRTRAKFSYGHWSTGNDARHGGRAAARQTGRRSTAAAGQHSRGRDSSAQTQRQPVRRLLPHCRFRRIRQILKKITTEPELSNRVKQLLLFVQTLLLCFMMNSNSICTHVTIEPVLHCNVYKSLRDTNKLFDAEERLYQLVKKHILGGGRKNDVQFYLRKKKTITSGLNTSASSSQSDGKNEALPEMYKTNPDFGDLFKMPVSQLRRIALHRRALIDQNCNTINEKNRKLNSFLTSSGVDLRLQQKLRQLEDRLALEEARFKKLTRLKEELNNYSLCYKSLVQQLDLLKMKMRNKKTEVELADQKVEELSRLLAKLKLQRILLAKRAEISLYDSEIGDLSCALSLPTTGSGSGADPGPSSGPGPGPDGQASSKLSVGSECSRVQGSRPKAAVEPFKIDTPDQDVECCSTEEAAAESGSKLDQYVRSKGFRTAFFAMQRALVEDATGDGRSVELPSDSDDHDVVMVDGGQPPPSAGPTEPLVKFVHSNASRRSNVRSELADSSQSPPPDLIPASEKSKFLGQGALASASDAALGDIVKAETDKIHLRSDTLRAAKRRSWAEHHANLATSDETEHIRLLLCRELKKGKTSVNLSWILDQLDSVGAATTSTSTSTTNALLSEPMRSSLSPSDEHLNYCRAKVTSSTTNNDDDTKLTLDSLTAVCCPQISDKLLCDSVEIEKNGKDDKVEVKEQLLEQQPQENDDDDDDDGGKEEEHEREEITIVVVDEEGPEVERRQRSGNGTTSTNRREAEPKPRRGILQGTSARCGDGPVRPRGVHFDPLALLLDAALEGELDLVKRCSKQLPNVSVCYEEGITALHNAICAGHYDIVRFLVEAGADVNAQDSDGWTPLHCAASCNNLPIVKFLVENGACIFASTLSDEETPAAKCEETEEGFVGCSQFLLGLQQRMGTMNGGIVYAAYSYDPERDDELGFEKDDQLRVLAKDLDGFSGWWRAFDPKSGREGYVPRNYLSLYPRPSQLRFTTRGGKNDQQEESRAKTAQ